MNGKNSKFSKSCEDAESLHLSEQSSACDLNLSDENSAAGATALNFKNKNSATAGVVETEAATISETAQNDIEITRVAEEIMTAEAAAKETEAARPQIQELTNFLSEYTAKMLSIGTYTARIEHCVRRIADAYDYEASLMIFVRHFIISVMDPADNSIRRTYVKTGAAAQISFDLISELSALSWEIYDEKIPPCARQSLICRNFSLAEEKLCQNSCFAKRRKCRILRAFRRRWRRDGARFCGYGFWNLRPLSA